MLVDLKILSARVHGLEIDLGSRNADYVPVTISMTVSREQAYELLRTSNDAMNKSFPDTFNGKVSISC